MAITAAQVKELREKTGAGMMDCKKALTECEGDIAKAVDCPQHIRLNHLNIYRNQICRNIVCFRFFTLNHVIYLLDKIIVFLFSKQASNVILNCLAYRLP